MTWRTWTCRATSSAPLPDRFLGRYQDAVAIVTEGIRRGQNAGRYRTDLDPAVKAVEIIAFLYGMETSWLLDPSIPLTDVFRGYASTLAWELALSPGEALGPCLQSIALQTDL
jgi:hypothetical protein